MPRTPRMRSGERLARLLALATALVPWLGCRGAEPAPAPASASASPAPTLRPAGEPSPPTVGGTAPTTVAPSEPPTPKGEPEPTPPGTIRGQVVAAEDGAPIARAEVYVVSGMFLPFARLAPSAVSDGAGRFEVSSVSAPLFDRQLGGDDDAAREERARWQRAWVFARAPGRFQATPVIEDVRPTRTFPPMRLTLSRGGRARGVVVAADGTPVAAAAVRAVWEVDTDEAFSPPIVFAAHASEAAVRTGPDGAFDLDGIPAVARLWLSVRADGHAPGRSECFELGPGEVRSGFRIVLPPGGSIVVRVAHSDGRPVVGAALQADRSMHEIHRMAGHRPGLFVVDPTEFPSFVSPHAVTDGSGTATFAHVPEGTYQIHVEADGAEPAEAAIARVVDDGAVEVRVTLAALGTLTGRVEDEAGRPLADLTLGFSAEGDLFSRTAHTDRDGAFSVRVPVGTTQRISVWSTEWNEVEPHITGAAGSHVVIRMRRRR